MTKPCTHPVYIRNGVANTTCRACLREEGFCRHGVPADVLCVFCRDGREPERPAEPTEPEREARKATVRAGWQRELAEMQADIYKAGRDARAGGSAARGLRGRS